MGRDVNQDFLGRERAPAPGARGRGRARIGVEDERVRTRDGRRIVRPGLAVDRGDDVIRGRAIGRDARIEERRLARAPFGDVRRLDLPEVLEHAVGRHDGGTERREALAHLPVVGEDPVGLKRARHDADFVVAAEERTLAVVVGRANGQPLRRVARTAVVRLAPHLHAVGVNRHGRAVVDERQVDPVLRQVGEDIDRIRRRRVAADHNRRRGVVPHFDAPAAVVRAVLVAHDALVAGGLAHVEPAAHRKDGSHARDARVEAVTAVVRYGVRDHVHAAGADHAVGGDHLRDVTIHARHRCGVAVVGRGVHRLGRRRRVGGDRLRHVPDGRIARPDLRRRRLRGQFLAVERTPAHHRHRSVLVPRHLHPDGGLARGVPRFDFVGERLRHTVGQDKRACIVHGEEAQVRAVRIRLVVVEALRRVLADTDEHREALERRRARVAGDREERMVAELLDGRRLDAPDAERGRGHRLGCIEVRPARDDGPHIPRTDCRRNRGGPGPRLGLRVLIRQLRVGERHRRTARTGRHDEMRRLRRLAELPAVLRKLRHDERRLGDLPVDRHRVRRAVTPDIARLQGRRKGVGTRVRRRRRAGNRIHVVLRAGHMLETVIRHRLGLHRLCRHHHLDADNDHTRATIAASLVVATTAATAAETILTARSRGLCR